MTRLHLAFAIAFTLSATPSYADDRAQAKTYFAAGEEAYRSGQYRIAMQAFEEAYRLAPLPQILFSLAQACRRQYFVNEQPGLLRRSVELYRKYLDAVPRGGRRDHATKNLAEIVPILKILDAQNLKPPPAAKPEPQKTQLMVFSKVEGTRVAVDEAAGGETPLVVDVTPGTHRIDATADGYFAEQLEAIAVEGRLIVVEVTLRERPATVRIDTTDGAELLIDGRTMGEAPLGRPLEIPAGHHELVVRRRGHRAVSRALDLERGQELKLEFQLQPTSQRTGSYWVLGGSALLAVGGGLTVGLAFGRQSAARRLLDKRDVESINLTEDERLAYNRHLEVRQVLTDASYGVLGTGAAMLVTGVLLYLLDSGTPPPGAAFPLAATVGPDSITLVWAGAF